MGRAFFLGLAACALALPGAASAQEQGASGQERQARQRNLQVQPYIEAAQIFVAELAPGDDVVTYTQLAAGVDATLTGRRSGASVSVRYERAIGWSNASGSDTLSGIARAYATVVPRALTIEAGALASRTEAGGIGSGVASRYLNNQVGSQLYAAYAGPNLHAEAGDVQLNGHYRFGYTRVETPAIAASGTAPGTVDVFDDSTVQSAAIHAATRPDQPLPVGVGLGAGIMQEDISNLDQRVRDAHVRADVTLPVRRGLAVAAGVGYEHVEVSARDAVRDASGLPVRDAAGRYLTDQALPRRIAYEVDGLIWDVGVIWRPSRRTAAEAHIGRRYGSTTYYGNFAWSPSSRSSVNLAVYDGVSGVGGQMTRALAALPVDFAAARDPLTGDITGCVSGEEGADCLTGAVGSVRSAVFRGRGITASYARQFGRMNAGLAAGYDRRSFIAASGTVLAPANGVTDESWYLAAFLDTPMGRDAGLSFNAYSRWLDTTLGADATAIGAAAAYRRTLMQRLSARGALAVDHYDSELELADTTAVSALVGLRYDF
ncbi:preprotein translocase subunit YajC [Qipengyuania sp. YIM B01966]|uniref:preprotein translocase subunit YajC n=1 Tax=Qipengyuania sp. YIM B01966 TaxID=2778646 RepID=UPI0018F6F3A3|nr:preprotein translocase subunit YajC [Qipengyuania sp. YIM B01966]